MESMNFDFQVILLVATIIFGLTWLIGHFTSRKDASAVEFSKALFPILLLVFLLRSFVFEPFRIPSGSMMPTLVKGDFILVKKYAYSLRFPITNNPFLTITEPQRGDVVVFNFPCDPSIKYIKRLVGLPGDEIVYKDKQLLINDELMPYRFQEVFKHPRQYGSHIYQENFRDEQHQILIAPSRRGVEGEYTVPEGHYFMMGDNRDNSMDSRYDCPGFVPWNHFVGTATRIWFNWDFENAPEWQRIWQTIE